MSTIALRTESPIACRSRAAYSLPGDVLEIRQNLAAVLPGGIRRQLPTGLYVLLGQRDNALLLARATENEEEQIVPEGLPYGVPVHILQTEAVRATYIRAAY